MVMAMIWYCYVMLRNDSVMVLYDMVLVWKWHGNDVVHIVVMVRLVVSNMAVEI